MSEEAEGTAPLRRPYLSLPGVTGMPDIGEILAHMPAEQQHRFESAGEFVKRLAHRVQKWRERLGEDGRLPEDGLPLPGGERHRWMGRVAFLGVWMAFITAMGVLAGMFSRAG